MRVIYLDDCRRLKLYDEGGMAQERHVEGFAEGFGWIVASDEDWLADLLRLRSNVADAVNRLMAAEDEADAVRYVLAD